MSIEKLGYLLSVRYLSLFEDLEQRLLEFNSDDLLDLNQDRVITGTLEAKLRRLSRFRGRSQISWFGCYSRFLFRYHSLVGEV